MSRKIGMLRLFALLGLLSLGGCASVNTEVDRSANFNRYKTFAWIPADIKVGDNPRYNSDLINRNIRYAVETEFAKRGIAKADQEKPADLLVGYHTYTEKKEQTAYRNVNPYNPYFGGWGWRGWGFPFYGGWGGWNAPYTRQYTEGTLIIDVLDARTNQLVWRGSVEGEVDNVARLQKRIRKGVEAIMKKYPAPVDKNLPEQRTEPIVS